MTYALKLFSLFGNTTWRCLKGRPLHTCNHLNLPVQSKQTRFDFKSHVQHDVLLFTMEKSRNLLIMNILSFTNCICWCYIGHFMIFTFEKTSFSYENKLFDWILHKEKKYSHILGSLSIVFGLSVFLGTILFSTRSVRSLVLHKGGRSLTIVTHSLPIFKNTIQVPVSEVSAESARNKAKGNMILKVKNKWFYYLLDMKGDFKNPSLFDFTAGVQRNF